MTDAPTTSPASDDDDAKLADAALEAATTEADVSDGREQKEKPVD
jgi:hypothetical protein